MKQVSTVCVSLEQEYIEALNRLAKKLGSRSAAVRYLLDTLKELQELRDMEEAYRAYFADTAAAAKERAVTDELLSVATWPPLPGGAHAGRRRPSR